MDPARTNERQATDEPERRPDTVAAAPATGLTSPASVVALQRSAGNAVNPELIEWLESKGVTAPTGMGAT